MELLAEALEAEKTIIKTLKNNSEARFIDFKQQLEFIGRNRKQIIETCGEESFNDYKDQLRDAKNEEECWMKSLADELYNHNQGMNPPWAFIRHKKKTTTDPK